MHEEGTMQDLIAVGFPGTHRAAEVLRQMQSLDAKGARMPLRSIGLRTAACASIAVSRRRAKKAPLWGDWSARFWVA
jgi:hypothetical protein